MKKNNLDVLGAVPKTVEGLRDALFDEINSLRSGGGNLQRARALWPGALLLMSCINFECRENLLLNELVYQEQHQAHPIHYLTINSSYIYNLIFIVAS